jgi:hypothetical protein
MEMKAISAVSGDELRATAANMGLLVPFTHSLIHLDGKDLQV